MLSAEDASFAYRDGRPVFHGLDLAAACGEVLCILGPNGVGKSTLLRCLAGLERPSSGSVRLDGQDVRHLSRAALARAVAFVPQSDDAVFAFTVTMMVEMGRAAHLGWSAAPSDADAAIARAALTRLGIESLAGRLYPELSGGERQLVLIARALAQQSQLLILDEPTAHLDFANQAAVLELIRDLANAGLAVVMTSHDPDHAFLIADRTLVLGRGQPARIGATRDILTETLLSQTYGRPIRIVHHDDRRLCFAASSGPPGTSGAYD